MSNRNLTKFSRNVLQDIADDRTESHREYAASDLLDHCDRVSARRYNACLHVMWMALVLSLALLVMCCTPRHTDAVRTIGEEHGAAVEIKAACNELPIAISVGSGVIISTGDVLTAAHVVHPEITIVDEKGKRKIKPECAFAAETWDGKLYPMTVTKEWPEHDIARLTTFVELPYTPVTFADMPEAGEDACIVARRPWRTRRCGEVQFYREHNGYRHITGVLVQPGNSGSGVYDKRGRLIGIAVVLFTCANGQWCEGAFSPLSSIEGGVL
jgi:S1-C subfamily serine protease